MSIYVRHDDPQQKEIIIKYLTENRNLQLIDGENSYVDNAIRYCGCVASLKYIYHKN